jgi:hypothetical protein
MCVMQNFLCHELSVRLNNSKVSITPLYFKSFHNPAIFQKFPNPKKFQTFPKIHLLYVIQIFNKISQFQKILQITKTQNLHFQSPLKSFCTYTSDPVHVYPKNQSPFAPGREIIRPHLFRQTIHLWDSPQTTFSTLFLSFFCICGMFTCVQTFAIKYNCFRLSFLSFLWSFPRPI